MGDEEKEIALLYANLKNRKKKSHDWITLANKVKKLSEYYGSHKELAKKLGMSEESLRETLKLLELPGEVQQLVKEGKLKHEVAWRIASIRNPKDQIRIAKEVADLNAHDARDIVRIIRKNPNINIKEFVSKFRGRETKIEKINLMIIPIKKKDYDKIKTKALKEKKSPEKFISEKIIHEWAREEK
jgi:biotin operon repressor